MAPTGSGKTVIGVQFIRNALDRGNRSLWIAHRRELIHQCAGKLEEFGVPHGLVMAGEKADAGHPVHVASVQTLARRKVPDWDVAFVDEAHRASAASYQRPIKQNPDGVLIGLTATPVRYDGKSLGNEFDALLEVAPYSELVRDGYIVAPRVFAPYVPDLGEARIVRGDFDPSTVDAIMGDRTVIGNVVDTWLERGDDRQTIGFARSVEASKAYALAFQERGVAAEHLDGTTPTKERDAILARFRSKITRQVWNCDVLTEGFDCPGASCAILARPTAVLSVFLQSVGRIMRPAPGVDGALVLDHAGNALRHGLPSEDRKWSLDAKKRVTRASAAATALRQCAECYAVVAQTVPVCPDCGTRLIAKPRQVRTASGELVEIDGEYCRGVTESRLRWLAERSAAYWTFYDDAVRQHRKPAFAKIQYKRKYGYWPSREVMGARIVEAGEADPGGDPPRLRRPAMASHMA